MNKYHTGYYLKLNGEKCTPDEYSKMLINDSKLELLSSNYLGKDWQIEWIFNNKWKGLEFILNADSPEIAQNVLFNVLCSAAVIKGTVSWSNEVHYPHEFGTIDEIHEIDSFIRPVKGFSDVSIPSYFYLASLASRDNNLTNSIVKYQLSTEIYSQHYIDLQEGLNWKTTDFNFIQIRFAYAIIAAYSIIEELGLDINASTDKPSKLENGDWNPVVLENLVNRLKNSNINIQKDISWMIRGYETEIEKKRPIKITRVAEWSDPTDSEHDFIKKVKDGYVYLPDAINHISFLRSSISSHKVGEKIKNLSVYDVFNAQFLARRLILEKVGLWK